MAASSFRAVAVAQLVVAGLLAIGIWVALPARYIWVDLLGSALAALYLASAIALTARRAWARRLASVASWVGLVLGLVTVTLLSLSVAHLSGQYGPVGRGGALLMGTIAALVLPYLVGLPLLQLRWLRRS
jgi:hypothetical protein